MAERSDWKEAERRILENLDIAAEYQAMGVSFIKDAPGGNGWQPCHAIDRKDTHASAAVCINGGARGRYKDMGGTGTSYNLWEFAARFGGKKDWREAREFFADKAGVKLPIGSEPKRPKDQLDFLGIQQTVIDIWCDNKGGFSPDAAMLAGACNARWPKRSKAALRELVIAFPGFAGPDFTNSDPAAWVIAEQSGRTLTVFKGKGQPSVQAKTVSVGGSIGSLLNREAVELLVADRELRKVDPTKFGRVEVVWKVEGLTDMLAVTTAIMERGLWGRHVAISNTGGTLEAVKSEWVELLAGKVVYVLHDADRPGRTGCCRWVTALAGKAAEVRGVILPYECQDNHGEDARDFLGRDKHTYDHLMQLAGEALPIRGNDPAALAQAQDALGGERSWPTPVVPEQQTFYDLQSRTTFSTDAASVTAAQMGSSEHGSASAAGPAGTAGVTGPQTSGLPAIVVNQRQLRDVTTDAMIAVVAANDPPTVFQRGALTRVRLDPVSGKPSLEVLDQDALRGVMGRCADWFNRKITRAGDVYVPTAPPLDVVRDLASLPAWNVPAIETIIECPVFDSTGSIVNTPGYNAGAKLWYHPDPKVVIPNVPTKPGSDELDRAKHLLQVELLGGFPFVDDASRANALAAILTPFVRPLIAGPTPLGLISAPTEGTGKGLLANVICLIFTGREAPVTGEFRDEAEAQKKLTALLLQAPQFVLLDNLSHTLDSATLAAVLTTPVWTERLLGLSKTVTIPVTCCWLATGNNPRLSKELVRRAYLVRLDAGVEHPAQRTGFRHPDLKGWARDNRGELIWAALTLCQAWIAAGRPRGTQRMGSYEAWVQTLGGILDVGGVPGFLGNADAMRRTVTDRESEWTFFVLRWASEFASQAVGVEQLFKLCIDNKLLDRVLGDKGERSQRTKLGKTLGGMRDKVIEGYRITEADRDHSGRQRYRLQRVVDVAGLALAQEEGTLSGWSAPMAARIEPDEAGGAGNDSEPILPFVGPAGTQQIEWAA